MRHFLHERYLRRLSAAALSALVSAGCGSSAQSDPVAQTSSSLVTSGPASLGNVTGALPFTIGTDISAMVPAATPEVEVAEYSGTGAVAAAPVAPSTSGISLPYNFGQLPGTSDARMVAGSQWNADYEYMGGATSEAVTTSAAASALTQAQNVGMEDTANPQGYLLGSISVGASTWTSLLPKGTPGWITSLGINVTSTPSDFRGYVPPRGRWRSGQWELVGEVTPPGWAYPLPEYGVVTNPAPAALADLRERGARLYCAARTVQAAQNGQESTLAKHTAAELNIFGQTLDFWNVEDTAAVAGPQKFDGGGGAQAFAIPINFGTSIAPLRVNSSTGGNLGELETPVVLVTGDSEVENGADYWTLIDQYQNQYQTVTHGDAIYVNGGGGLSWGKNLTLAKFWLITISLGINISAQHGTLAWGGDSGTLDGVLNPSLFAGALSERYGFATQNASGWAYQDGGWTRQLVSDPAIHGLLPQMICGYDWRMQVGSSNDPDLSWRFPSLGGGCASVAGPMDVRALMDDDHAFSLAESIALTGTLNASAGLTLGSSSNGIDISIGINGFGLTAKASYLTMVRDGLAATRDSSGNVTPAAGLTIRPRTVNSLSLDPPAIVVTFKLHLHLPIVGNVSISFSEPIIPWGSTPTPIILSQSDSDTASPRPFGESNYLRILTGGVNGDPTNQPTVNSHLPAGTEFASFPQSVGACLSSTTPNPATPASGPPDQTNPDPTPTQYNMCLYAPIASRTPLLCSAVNTTYPVAGGAEDQCLNAYYSFLCSGTYTNNSTYGIVHLWDPSDPTQMTAYNDAIEACGPYATTNGTVDLTQLTTIATGLTKVTACDASANPVSSTTSATQTY